MKAQISLGMREIMILLFAIVGLAIILLLVFLTKGDVISKVNYLFSYQP